MRAAAHKRVPFRALTPALLAWFVLPLTLPAVRALPPLVAVVATATLHIAVFAPIALLGWRSGRTRLAGAAFGLAAAAGYLALLGSRAALLPGPAPLASALDLLLALAYLLLLVAPLYGRLLSQAAGGRRRARSAAVGGRWSVGALARSYRSLLHAGLAEIGLLRPLSPRLPLLAAALAAPFAAPWVVVGALGSREQVVVALLQALGAALGLELLLRGFVLGAARAGGARDRSAIVWSGLVGALLIVALIQWSAVGDGVGAGIVIGPVEALLAGLLFGAVQVGSGGALPATLLLAFVYHAGPLLFLDPRADPNLTFLAVRALLALLAVILAVAVGLSRGALVGGRAGHGTLSLGRPLAAAGLLWSVVGGLHVGLGAPGLNEDGFIIVLSEQADLGAAAQIPDRLDRLRYVRRELIETASRTQAPLRAELDSLGASYRPYYLVNMIRVDGRPDLRERFADRPEVARIDRNPNARAYRSMLAESFPGRDEGPAVEPSLERIGVPAAWELGVRGAGVLVAGADTGYQWDHPALKAAYAGWDGARADHDYHWHDAWDGTAAPVDDSGHGTHTMGTVVGDDGLGHRIGVAPEARWIGCRNMRFGLGNPGAYTECMEFFLAPYPHGGDPFTDGDPARAPMVVNNSWGCPDEEGCNPDTLKLAMSHMRAAGIMMVVSAGNSGPECSTIDVAPALYDSVFAVGALSQDNWATPEDESLLATPFSSRGPVTVDGSGRVKPDISAPGQWIRSSVPGGYARASGTSMAGPHVTGAAALLFSAAPQLAGDIPAAEEILRDTARPLEEPAPSCTLQADRVPNNTYGAGALDVAAAVRAALALR